jgi:thiol-disulfide isomerase/thioredoxin
VKNFTISSLIDRVKRTKMAISNIKINTPITDGVTSSHPVSNQNVSNKFDTAKAISLKILRGVSLLLCILNISSCVVMDNKFSLIAPGIWRAELQLAPKEMVSTQDNEIHSARQLLTDKNAKVLPEDVKKRDEATEGALPFLFEIKYLTDSTFTMTIMNGEERILVPAEDIKVGRNRETGKDTILINFPVFGSYIRGMYKERVMEGEWIVPAKNLTVPFLARYGQQHRFTTLAKKPMADLTGKWACTFDLASEKPYNAVGELTQNGNILRGTFRTETGDYRYLDGEVQAEKFYLSCFDGAHAFVFEGKIKQDGRLDGIFRSGKGTPEIWQATRNENAELKDAKSLTTLKSNNSTVSFSFPNADGKMIGLNDYKGKVKILQIMGTWCPNCRDETNFLSNYVNTSKNDNLAVVALAFERNADIAARQIGIYKEKMRVPYDIVIAGTTTQKEDAAKALPWLSQVIAYPTLVILDKNDKVRRIHTGFDGPATSKYAAFEKEFKEFVEMLLKE